MAAGRPGPTGNNAANHVDRATSPDHENAIIPFHRMEERSVLAIMLKQFNAMVDLVQVRCDFSSLHCHLYEKLKTNHFHLRWYKGAAE